MTMWFMNNNGEIRKVALICLPYGIGYGNDAVIDDNGRLRQVNVGTLYYDAECTRCLL